MADATFKIVDQAVQVKPLGSGALAASDLLDEATGIANTAAAVATEKMLEASAAASESVSAAGAASIAILIQGTLGAVPSSLPYEVTAITGGGGTGGTPGTYIGTTTGGPPGFQWSVFVGSNGVAVCQIDNPGLSTSSSAPTLTMPAISGLTGATAPTATVGTIPVNRIFYAPSLDGLQLLSWGNNAGALATAPFGAAQLAIATPLGVAAQSARLNAMIPDASNTHMFPASGNLGEQVIAFLDAAGYLGAGLGADGAWNAKTLRALTSLIAPLLTMPYKGAINMGSQSAINFAGDGKMTSATGGTVSMQGMNYDFAICDANNNVMFGLMGGKIYGLGTVTKWVSKHLTMTTPIGVTFDLGQHNYDFCICDTSGNVAIGYLNGVLYLGSGTTNAAQLDEADAAAKAHTARVNATRVTNVQRPTAKWNGLYLYGQSLGQGDETWPALSRTNLVGTSMLGGNTMSSTDDGTYTQFAPTGLQPLVAQTVNGATQYTLAQTASFTPGDGSRGEPPNIGWARGAKLALNDYLLLPDGDTTRSIVAVNIAKSGATIAQLAKGGTAAFYGKVASSSSQLVTAVGSDSLVIPAIMYMQGEFDYYQATGASQNLTYALYKPALTTLAANLQADLQAATVQSKPPAFLIYQTGGSFTRDVDGNGVAGLHIGMAQLDFAMAADTAWMVGPVYPYPDKGGHLDSNGSRWFGHMITKVWRRLMLEGRDWEPVRPLKIWQDSPTTICIAYHVPVGPLVFDTPQLANGTVYNDASRGFRCTDDTGSFSVTSAEVVRDTIIRLTCSRTIGANPKVWYASQGTTGNGMVRDSDPSVATDNYVYETGGGMYATANLPQFVNKPYPLPNWSVAFYLPVGYSE